MHVHEVGTLRALCSRGAAPSCNQVPEGASVGIPWSYTFMSGAKRNRDQTTGKAVLIGVGATFSCAGHQSRQFHCSQCIVTHCCVWCDSMNLRSHCLDEAVTRLLHQINTCQAVSTFTVTPSRGRRCGSQVPDGRKTPQGDAVTVATPEHL